MLSSKNKATGTQLSDHLHSGDNQVVKGAQGYRHEQPSNMQAETLLEPAEL